MTEAWVIFFTLQILKSCLGEGNIHLLEEEVAAALRACSRINDNENSNDNGKRYKRSESNYNYEIPRIDGNTDEDVNPYTHTRRNTIFNQMHVLNGSDYDYLGYGAGSEGEKFINSIPRSTMRNDNKTNGNYTNSQNDRVKRNEPLMNKNDNDQVDSQGIPREAEVWNRVQTSVTSQQSRVLLRDQIRACFQESQSDSEDNGCSYSNKLERCLMLRLSDRKINGTQNNSTA